MSTGPVPAIRCQISHERVHYRATPRSGRSSPQLPPSPGDHDLTVAVTVGVAAVDHQVGDFPGTVGSDVGVLLGHPARVRVGRDLTGGHPFGVAGEPGRLVRLDPDGDGKLRSYGCLGCADSFRIRYRRLLGSSIAPSRLRATHAGGRKLRAAPDRTTGSTSSINRRSQLKTPWCQARSSVCSTALPGSLAANRRPRVVLPLEL